MNDAASGPSEESGVTADPALAEIMEALSAPKPIPRKQVMRWLASDDLEVMGAAAYLITYSPYWERIEPPLWSQEMEDFLFRYYECCLEEDPQMEWADSRYQAAASIYDWFKAVPDEACLEGQMFLVRLKDWLARAYVEGSDEVRTAIVAGALEHIFEEPRWRDFFSDWFADPVLASACRTAMEWAVAHERATPRENDAEH